MTRLLSCYFTSTEARWPVRDRDRVGRGRESEGSTAETVKRFTEKGSYMLRVQRTRRNGEEKMRFSAERVL